MSVSESVSKLRLGKIESWTRSRIWDSEIYSLGLGLEIETLKFTVSDSVSKLRLRKFESRTRSRNWDSENFSLGLGLKTETQKVSVSDPVSKLRLWKFQSRTRSQNTKVGLADPCLEIYLLQPLLSLMGFDIIEINLVLSTYPLPAHCFLLLSLGFIELWVSHDITNLVIYASWNIC